jgi:hypothetical protein
MSTEKFSSSVTKTPAAQSAPSPRAVVQALCGQLDRFADQNRGTNNFVFATEALKGSIYDLNAILGNIVRGKDCLSAMLKLGVEVRNSGHARKLSILAGYDGFQPMYKRNGSTSLVASSSARA